jgi:hypothetical protein
MATTTNYGWTTPDDTALVKDGAAAIRSLGTSIDTTVFNNASAGIAKTIVDAKGDLIAATAADTVARLAVGTNDQVLMADSTTATGLKWGTPAAGSMTLISTTTLSGSSQINLTSIPQTYTNLYLILKDTNGGAQDEAQIRLNNDSASNYSFSTVGAQGGTNVVSPSTQANAARIGSVYNLSTNWYFKGNFQISIPRYTETSGSQAVYAQFIGYGGGGREAYTSYISYNRSAGISQITLIALGANWSTGTAYLYGVN